MLKSNRLVRGAILAALMLVLSPWLVRGQVAPQAIFASPAFLQESIGSRAFLGVGVRDVDAERVKALNLKEEYGVEVIRVEDGSPAMSAGIKKGDVVLSYNGQRVEGTQQFVRFIRETPPGRTVKLSIVRDGAQQTASVALGTRKAQVFGPSSGELHVEVPEMPEIPEMPEMPEMNIPMPDVPRAMMSWRNSVLGVEAESLGNTQLAAYFGVKDGVLVRAVVKGTAAEKAGLKAGDVLLKVDNERVSSPRDVTNSIREARSAGKKTIPVTLMRERKELTVSVTLDDPQLSVPKPRASQVNHPKL